MDHLLSKESSDPNVRTPEISDYWAPQKIALRWSLTDRLIQDSHRPASNDMGGLINQGHNALDRRDTHWVDSNQAPSLPWTFPSQCQRAWKMLHFARVRDIMWLGPCKLRPLDLWWSQDLALLLHDGLKFWLLCDEGGAPPGRHWEGSTL